MPDTATDTARVVLARWGARIRERRRALGKLTQAELAAMVEPSVSQGTIHKIEKAEMFPSDVLKVRIAHALRMDLDTLWNWDVTR